MFRLTLRELLLLAVTAGIGTAWVIEHKAHATAREDAKYLARFGDPFFGSCGQTSLEWQLTAEKYWHRDSEALSWLESDS
jgi:hypothetical protein